MKTIKASELKKGDFFKSNNLPNSPLKRVTKVMRSVGILYYEFYNYSGMELSLNSNVYVYESGMFALIR